MKRVIRKSVFESNSSSMHSLVVKKENEYFTEQEVRSDYFHIDKNGLLHRGYDSDDFYFGRHPFRVLSSLKDKANYVLAAMCNYKDDEVYNEVCDVINSYIPEFKDFELEFEVIGHSYKYFTKEEIERWYGKDNYIKKDDKWITWGYKLGCVDEDILTGFLKEENITITEFLKNKKYVVIVDGDEYCIYHDMIECGLINTDNIEKEWCNGKWRNINEAD